ncbi:triosephosphate isomerase [Thermodesulfatator indicus DSM 15286]|uniref:Triosephosphate isomerase n=1 Tax=Thermodesulfatator indicus (strain DSM 15286 / JCM 11887 / CIR29812) TaxID=667014 RepID=F8A989_THEID|nr:triose-phosphate isomerase [Thermodesulfatator indicus]AEH45278.1 triosephosphate isomerase [Thermodesulfatator indicus DSM 15286]
MKRRPLIAGNWKMHKTVPETLAYIEAFKSLVAGVEDRDIMLAPPFTSLDAAERALEGTNIYLGAQNCHWADEGAFTGEISPKMLADIGVTYVIIGHSERRHIFGETDKVIRQKIEAVLKYDLIPILCIGETLEEREAGKTLKVLETQLKEGLKGFSVADLKSLVVAYEPVWAIGTGKTATPEQAEEAHAFVRKILAEMFNQEFADNLRILYGGSVKPENVVGLMARPDIDGALVGGASLKPDVFAKIVCFGRME